MAGKPKVLLVEDQKMWQLVYLETLQDRAEMLVAGNIGEAERLFAQNSDITAIIMDACVPGQVPTTIPLVRKFRLTFSGPMIAISSRSEYRQELVRAGCSHECVKHEPEQVLAILGL